MLSIDLDRSGETDGNLGYTDKTLDIAVGLLRIKSETRDMFEVRA